MPGREVTIRVLDIGGDKPLPYFPIEEQNPFLGWRGVRVSLAHPEIFLTQVRAMLRAAVDLDNLQIMLPMISSVGEVDELKMLIKRAHDELLEEGYAVSMPLIGVMIEVPSAVYLIEELAQAHPELKIVTMTAYHSPELAARVQQLQVYTHLVKPIAPSRFRQLVQNALQGKPTKTVRPRVLVYVSVLTFISAALVYALLTRIPLEVDVLRDRNVLYTETDEGLVQNVYNLKIINKHDQSQRYRLSVSGLEGLRVIGNTEDIEIESGAVAALPLRIEVDPIALKSPSSEIIFHVESTVTPEIAIEKHARFLGPVMR